MSAPAFAPVLGGAVIAALTVALAACGNDDQLTPSTTRVSTAVTSGPASSSGALTSSVDSATGVGGAGGMGGAEAGGQGGQGGQGGYAMVNDCTFGGASDMTNKAIVTLPEWSDPHQSCVRVSAGAAVIWNTAPMQNFGDHPLRGGVPPNIDFSSPITQEDAFAAPAMVAFDTPGTYPYFCDTHFAGMQGVVYVVP